MNVRFSIFIKNIFVHLESKFCIMKQRETKNRKNERKVAKNRNFVCKMLYISSLAELKKEAKRGVGYRKIVSNCNMGSYEWFF